MLVRRNVGQRDDLTVDPFGPHLVYYGGQAYAEVSNPARLLGHMIGRSV